MCKVSVIIPTYKHRDFVLATLDSVFAQTFTDYEVIVVNDGSPDDTADVLKPLAEAGRIRYIEQANQGQAAARNCGIAEASGDFVALLDDDDLWPSDKLSWQVASLRDHPDAVFVYGGTSLVGGDFNLAEHGETEYPLHPGETGPSGYVYEELLVRNPLYSPGQALIRTATLKQINGFDENIWGADDYDLYIRLAREGRFLYRNHCALYYRKHSNNASANLLKMYKNVCSVRRKHLGRFPRLSSYRLWLKSYLYWRGSYLDDMLTAVRLYTKEGNKSRARQVWCWALMMPPKFTHLRYMFYLLRCLR